MGFEELRFALKIARTSVLQRLIEFWDDACDHDGLNVRRSQFRRGEELREEYAVLVGGAPRFGGYPPGLQ